MSNFNYQEYLRNNPLLKPEVKDSLITESKEVTEESVEEVQETSSKMKVSELKAKIKEDIMSLLQEEDNSSELEDELIADLDEEITEAEEDEDIEAEIEADVEDEDMEDEVGGGDAEALDPEAGLSQDEQDIQNALKVAYDNAVELGDEKLSKQIGNTITMFTRTRVVGDI